ncbi:MAG: hypothetical protein U0871_18595 [Gemmataceae bacterium]
MDREVRFEDVAGLQSRVSWGAIIAGSVIALAVYMLLALFFAGLGLALTEAGVRAGTATNIAVVCSVISWVAALFCGGCVTTQLTAGETRREAWIHGVLTWAAVTALTLMMVGMGLRGGYNALLGAALVGSNVTDANGQTNWEQAARQAGVPQERIDQIKQGLRPENIREQANNPETRQDVRQGALVATWATFAGTLLSIGAAILGALAGMGPTFRLFPRTAAITTATTVTAERRDIPVNR